MFSCGICAYIVRSLDGPSETRTAIIITHAPFKEQRQASLSKCVDKVVHRTTICLPARHKTERQLFQLLIRAIGDSDV